MGIPLDDFQNEPYIILDDTKQGQEKFSGYGIDLIKQLAERANFTPNFYLVADGAYGSHVGGGVWNGLIGDLMKHVSLPKPNTLNGKNGIFSQLLGPKAHPNMRIRR